ncbi:MAG: molecular chaperone-like protein [Planctomycetes bacterium B3_Pla]|nr:MAG: molecular chaperone-like protein [Planctomycetes bacterium B3_Pla]
MSDSSILAIDFGTTNSYFCKCPADQISPVGVDFGSGRDGIPTAILYRQNKKPLVGNPALHEYGESSNEERKDYRLCTQFKPDITTSEDAAKNAEDFLRTVVEQSQRQHIVLEPARSEVIIGVPSEAEKSFRAKLTEIAEAAGYGRVKLLDEPKGALLSHLWHKDFSPDEALRGVLIVDFGGGTCDFAFLRSLEECLSWGDMELGGRLFDDLFFQWLLEQNAGAMKKIEKAGDTYYVHSYLCREVKEFFSLTMVRDRSESVNKSVGQYGSVRDMSWTTFIQKARAYNPSRVFAGYLQGVGLESDRLLGKNDPIDLIEWFRTSLTQGLADKNIDTGDISRVILAGGSSQWPFVSDVISESLGLDASKLMRSDRPYAVISEGLAIFSPLQKKFEKTRSRLRTELPEFCRAKVRSLVHRTTDAYVVDVATDIILELFDKRIRPVLLEYKTTGGSLAELKKSVSSKAKSFEPELKKIVESRMETLSMGLSEQVRDVLTRWIESHGLSIGDAQINQGRRISIGGDAIGSELPDLYGGIMDAVGWFVVGTATSIGAILCGGAGTAILISGPIGLIGGAVLALVIAYLTVRQGKEKAAKLAENWDAPAWVIKRALTNSKIHKARQVFRSQLEERLRQETLILQDEFEARIRKITELQIEGLSEITQL